MGGVHNDRGEDVAVDTSGNVYVTGYTNFSGWVSAGLNTALNSDSGSTSYSDGFVVKFNTTGEHLWSTYLGGTDTDQAYSIEVDSSENCYITGLTNSADWVSGGEQITLAGHYDGFVVKLNTSGEHLWSTYLGGTAYDMGYGITVDSTGNCYATGETTSTGWVSGGWDPLFGGWIDAYVVKLNSSGEHLWSTYLGGSYRDYGYGITADSSGNCYVTGETHSSDWVSGGWDITHDPGYKDYADGYVVKLNSAGEHQWSTYLGDTYDDYGKGIAVDSSGNCYVTGYGMSTAWVSGGYQTILAGYYDAYIVKLNSAGEHLWSTYMGGKGKEQGYGIAVDSNGNVYATGDTESSDWFNGGFDLSQNGGLDGYVVKLNPFGEHLWSACLGGNNDDTVLGIAVDIFGNAFVTGHTNSSGWISGGWSTSFNGETDAFVLKIAGVNTIGNLQVTLTPQEAVMAGAQWRRVFTNTWWNSGDTESDIPAGLWTIEFKDVPGYAPSEAHIVSVPSDDTVQDTGIYTPVSIDMEWSTYLGGTSNDCGYGIAVDPNGNAYITGFTTSSGWVNGGFQTIQAGDVDAFVVKLNMSGAHLWSTYLGGVDDDWGNAIAVDTNGNCYVTGITSSPDWTSGGYQTAFAGVSDGFVVKLNTSGAHLWSTYLGGTSDDSGEDIAVDADGNSYVTGTTDSPGWISGGWNTIFGGNSFTDGFVVKLTTGGLHLWSTYLGGTSIEYGQGIAVDGSGCCYVTGETTSSGWISGGWQTIYDYSINGYVVKLDALGEHLWSTYLGGTSSEFGEDIAVDNSGNCFIVGETGSSGWVSGGWDTTYFNGYYGPDGFLVKLSTSGAHLWSTYLGGTNGDYGLGVAVDPAGCCYATGYTKSDGWLNGGGDITFNGGSDAYVVKFNAAGEHLWSSYLGGTGYEIGYGIALDPNGNCYLTGDTSSSWWVSGGWITTYIGNGDAFVAKIRDINETGNLQVTLSPPEAVAAGAQWRRASMNTWKNSGDIETGLVAGLWRIEFKDVCGWTQPDLHLVAIPSEGTALDSGVYDIVFTEGAGEGEGQIEFHTADQNHDNRINLSELLRVIQFHNAKGFHCQSSTEDGYVPGTGGDQTCSAHASDYNPKDWTINLSEVLRLIQFYNSPGYHACTGSEDSFCPDL